MKTSKPYKTLYHVFTNNMDDWFGDYKTAKVVYDEWVREYGDVRLYEERYDTKHNYEYDMNPDEDCLESSGNWPT